jgi:hypothetical protein
LKHLIFLLLVPLAACGDPARTLVTPPPVPRITPPSPVALADCQPPVKLRAGPATQQQVEIAWSVDNDHLIDCGRRHKILANYIRKRDAGLAGK